MSNKVWLVRQTVKEIIELSAKSAILADSKSKLFCEEYTELSKRIEPGNKASSNTDVLLESLCQDHGMKTQQLNKYINKLAMRSGDDSESFKLAHFDKLNANLKPEYYSLFQNLGRVNDGVKTLVKMREDVLRILAQRRNSSADFVYEEDFKIMNSVLKNLLVLWFSVGLLNVKRIDWNSSASLVEKVAQYESVHRMRTLSDLKGRLSKARRCFIYTHSTMPYEPLVILHIALTNEVTNNIRKLIKPDNSNTADNNADTVGPDNYTNAIFYSINSCQKGLQQVDLGNALIKRCVRLLLEEMPNLTNFHTLSPIPKFREWIDLKLADAIQNEDMSLKQQQATHYNPENALRPNEKRFLAEYFQTNERPVLFESIKAYLKSSEFKSAAALVCLSDLESQDESVCHSSRLDIVMMQFLKRSCAFYLYHEKKNAYAFNPVANFHLRNGAHIFRINPNGDLSDNGWKLSYGFMVNYGYKLDELDANCIRYLSEKKINISQSVLESLQVFEQTIPSKI